MKPATLLFYILVLSLHICFGQQTRLVLPFGHSKIINSARFSNNGKLILTASDDSTAIIWDVVTGNQLYALKGHRRDVQTARTSYDERYIVTGSSDSTAIIWDEKTGDSIQILPHPNSVINAFFLSGDNELITETKDSIFSWTQKGNAWFLKARTKGGVYSFNETEYLYHQDKAVFLYSNKTHSSIPIDIKKGFTTLALYMSPHKYIVSDEDSGFIKLYSKQDGIFLKQIKLAANNEYHSYPAFDEEESVMIYKPLYFSKDSEGTGSWQTDDSLSFINLQSGKLLKRKAESGSHVYTLGKDSLLITGNDSRSYIYSISKNRVLKELVGSWAKKNISSNAILSVDFNKIVLTRLPDNSTTLLQTTALESHFLTNDSILQNRFFTDRSAAFTWNFRDSIFLLTKDSLRLSDAARLNSSYAKNGYFSTMGMQFHTEASSEFEILFDEKECMVIRTKNKRQVYVDTSCNVKEVRLHEASNTFAIVDKQNMVSMFSLSTGKKLFNLSARIKDLNNYGGVRSLKAFQAADIYDHNFELNGIWRAQTDYFYNKSGSNFYEIHGGITNNGYLLSYMYVWSTTGALVGKFTHAKGYGKYSIAYENENVVVLDSEYSQKLLTVPKDHAVSRAICFENKLFLEFDDLIEIHNISTGKLENTIRGRPVQGSLVYDSLGKHFIAVSPKQIVIYNQALEPVRTIQSSNLPFGASLKFIKENQLLLIASERYLTILSLRSNRYFHLFFPDHNNWIVLDENGNFDGTEEARKTLYLTCGTEVVNLEQVKDQLWVPNLAERTIKGEAINAKRLEEMNICGFTPEVEKVAGKEEEYYFKIKPRRGGLGETVLLINGIEARRFKPEALKRNGASYDLVIAKSALQNLFIPGKENPVTIKAFTKDNGLASRGVILLEDKTKQSTTPANLYALMVGVSDYKGAELDLKYAAKDATDLSGALSVAAKKLLNADAREHVFMYNLTTANEHYLLPEKNSIKKVLEEIGKKATANDILLIFFAGHGIMDDESKKFYFLTADASKASAVSSIADVGISTAELTEWMKPQNIAAQKRILIFDACNSGQAIKDFVKLGSAGQEYIAARNDDKAQQIKAIDKLNEKSGLFILSASSSNQSAYEMGRYSQGLLTYALLRAIKQQPDILENGKYLDLSRWFNAAEKTVSEISRQSGARQEPQIVSNTNFNIGIVDEEVMSKIVLSNEKPLFAASNFQNNDREIADDDLEISAAINSQLSDIASRGAEGGIVFNASLNAKDTYTLTGGYDVNGDVIFITVNVKQNKLLKSKFELTGNKNQLKALVEQIALRAADLVKTF